MANTKLTYHEKISENKSFIVKESESQEECSVEPHWHTSIELLYVYQGTLTVEIDHFSYTLHDNDILYIKSMQNHALIYQPNTRSISLKISPIWLYQVIPDFFQENIFLYSGKTVGLEARNAEQELKKNLLILKDLFYAKDKYADIGVNGYIFLLVYELMTNFRSEKSLSSKFKYDSRLRKIIQYMQNHYQDDIQLKELADMLYVSPQYISKLFHNYYSMTYKQYLTQIRLEHAVYDIYHTNDSFLKIAINCGFSSQHSFIESFKKHYQMTPSEFRNHINK